MSIILTAPHPILRQVAKPISQLDKKVLSLIADMTTAMLAAKNPTGVGLAAPQVGVPLRLFLIRPTPRSKPQVFINPEILKYSQRTQSSKDQDGVYEGCLSIPHHYAPLTRSLSVTVRYQKPTTDNLQLTTVTETLTGFPAHIVQHELDHLNGILFIDRVLEQNSPLFKVSGKTWEQITL